jgi:hypothetical protein
MKPSIFGGDDSDDDEVLQRAIPFNIHTPLLTIFSEGGLKF